MRAAIYKGKINNVVKFWFSLGILVLTFCSAQAADQTFVSGDKEQYAKVALFEFSSTEQQTRAIELAKSLRCPQCLNQNLVESNSPVARDLRLKVYTMVEQGHSDKEIIEFMTTRFGEFVMYKPKFTVNTWILWLCPLLLLLVLVFRTVRSVKR